MGVLRLTQCGACPPRSTKARLCRAKSHCPSRRREGVIVIFSDAAIHLCGLMARFAGWTPDIFWNATPTEADMVLGGWGEGGDVGAPPPPDAALRAQLMEMFPDG